jgi:hypothetical protein
MPAREAGRPSGRSPNGVVELVDRPRKPPPAPRKLDAPARKIWRELYAEPVADLWRPVDAALVLRLVVLRRRLELEGAEAPGWVYGVMQGHEDRLLLNPRARRVAGVVYVEPEAASSGSTVRRIDERRRARIARG